MSRFNTTTIGAGKTTTHEGGESYRVSAEMGLYATICTTFLSPKFYESDTDTIRRIRELVPKVSPEFAGQLALYARHKMNLRSASHVLIVEALRAGHKISPATIASVVVRPDDMTEILAYNASLSGGGKKMPHALRKGLAKAFVRFDEYRLGKYAKEQAAFSLKDAMFLTHPKPKDEAQAALWAKLIDGSIAVPYTWETRLSEAGQKKEGKNTVWEELIDSGQIGYMAMLRNLRNILEAGVSDTHIQKVCGFLADRERVLKSRQLPFRFFSAYREVSGVASPHSRAILKALEDAVLHSTSNMEGFNKSQRVLIVFDVSGSMQQPLSGHSKVQLIEVGQLLAGLGCNVWPNSVGLAFATTAAIVTPPPVGLLGWVTQTQNQLAALGGGTNGHLAFQWLCEKKEKFDRVLLFSDMQMWNADHGVSHYWRQYRKEVNPEARLYSFDLAGYGKGAPVNVQSGDNASLIAGWSDEIFTMLSHLESGGKVVEEIRNFKAPEA